MTHSTDPLWTSEEAIKATGGTSVGQWQAEGVSIDSRSIEPGDLFVAIIGPSNDGHQYVENGFKMGAAAAVVDKPEFSISNLENKKLLRVESTTSGLLNLAKFARARTAAKIIAVTGSVGKTGSKEMLKMVLGEQGKTTATAGNLNNHWGLPLSLVRMPKETEFGVFEMGMNHSGEIIPLTKVARPHVALITTVEQAHSEHFKSIEDIADAKAEIFVGVEPSGTVVLNADNLMFERLLETAKKVGIMDVRTFGSESNSDCRLVNFELGANGSRVVIDLRGKQIKFQIGVPGFHWVKNALGVLCAVDAAGADAEMAAEKLIDMGGLKGRGRQHVLSISGGTFIMIDESYNASPASMKAAIEVLGDANVDGAGRKIAVLGDMLELGSQAISLHESLVESLSENQIDLVFTTGQYMSALSDVLPSHMRGGHATTSQKLLPMVRSVIRPSDVVTIKGSLGSKTGLIVDELLKLECDLGRDTSLRHMAHGN